MKCGHGQIAHLALTPFSFLLLDKLSRATQQVEEMWWRQSKVRYMVSCTQYSTSRE